MPISSRAALGIAKLTLTRLLQLTTLAWLPVHFSLSLLYTFPLNPLKVAMEPTLYATIGRYFSQNWSLFAPNPLSENRTLLVRCLDRTEANDVVKGTALPRAGWFDLTQPLVAMHQAHRFSAYDRVARPQTNALRAYLGAGGNGLEGWAKACQAGDKPSCSEYSRRIKEARVVPTALLVRIASSFCEEARPKSVAASLRLRTTQVIPWSHRDRSEPPKSMDYELGSYPLFDEAAPGPALAANGEVR